MRKVAERHLWAAKIIDAQPMETILEIGCGTGILAGQLAARLEQGQIHALDRSPALVEKAIKKNRKFLDNGRMKIYHLEFLEFESPLKYDKVVAFNVNFFQRENARELNKIKELLATDGSLFVFFQAPYKVDLGHGEPIMRHLLDNGYRVRMVELMPEDPISALGVIVKP